MRELPEFATRDFMNLVQQELDCWTTIHFRGLQDRVSAGTCGAVDHDVEIVPGRLTDGHIDLSPWSLNGPTEVQED